MLDLYVLRSRISNKNCANYNQGWNLTKNLPFKTV